MTFCYELHALEAIENFLLQDSSIQTFQVQKGTVGHTNHWTTWRFEMFCCTVESSFFMSLLPRLSDTCTRHVYR